MRDGHVKEHNGHTTNRFAAENQQTGGPGDVPKPEMPEAVQLCPYHAPSNDDQERMKDVEPATAGA